MITITDPHGRRLELHGDWQGQPRGTLIYDAAEGIPGGVPIRGEKTRRWGTGTVPDRVTRDGRTMTIGGWAHFGRGRADLVLDAVDRISGCRVVGYEMHMGRTTGPDCARPFAYIPQPDGATSTDGGVAGTYLHGLFASNAFRSAWLAGFGMSSALDYGAGVDEVLDRLALHLEIHLDIERLLGLAR